jgi:hypothetical protein
MGPAFPAVQASAALEQITPCITRDCPAVFVNFGDDHYDTLTKYDLLHAISRVMEQAQ